MDALAIEASFSPTEQYGLNFREKIDPFVLIFQLLDSLLISVQAQDLKFFHAKFQFPCVQACTFAPTGHVGLRSSLSRAGS